MAVNVIELVATEYVTDDIGNQIKKESIRKCYCETKSITQTEFYKARESKLGIKYVLVINAFDYKGETLVNYHGSQYKVMRTYTTFDDKVELYIGE